MRQPLTSEQKKKINKSTDALVNKPLTVRQLLMLVREFVYGAHQKVSAWFDEERAKWVTNLSEEEKAEFIEEYRASVDIPADEYDDEEDLLAVAATKISKDDVVQKVTECFGAPPGNDTSANAVFTLHDPREDKGAENDLVKGFAAFPPPNTNARSELEVFGPDAYAVALIMVDNAEGSESYQHLVLGKPRTYRAAARITGRISLSKSGPSLAIAFIMQYGEYIGIPTVYHLLDETMDDDGKKPVMSRPDKIRDIGIYGPSVLLSLIACLTTEDFEAICAYELNDLVGASAKPEAVTTYRSAMRRAYHKAVEAGEICEDANIEGSTQETPLPEDSHLWSLISSPAMALLVPTCVWAYNCQFTYVSLVEPMSIEDIRSAVNRAHVRAKERLQEDADSAVPMVDDISSFSSSSSFKAASKSKSKGNSKSKKATLQIDPIDLQVVEELRGNLEKSIKCNFTNSALRSLREEKGMPSKEAQKAYTDADEADAPTLVLNSALCLDGVTPHQRGYYLTMLKKSKKKVGQQYIMARERAKTDPVMNALFKKLKPNEVGTPETNTVSVRAITQALITSGMQIGELARQHAKAQSERQLSGALAAVDCLEDVINRANTSIGKANKLISSLEQSEQHLASELSAKDKEIAALRAEPEKLKAELLEAKCKSVKAAENVKKTKTKLSDALSKVEELEKKIARLTARNKELKKKAEQQAPAPAQAQDEGEGEGEGEDPGELATFLMDEKDLKGKTKRDLTKSAAEAGSDEDNGDTDEEDGDDDSGDAASAVFGTKTSKKKSTASVLAQMGDDGEDESEAYSEDEEDGEDGDELTAEDFSRDGAGESAARKKKRSREEDEGSSGKSESKLQKTKHSSPDADAPIETVSAEADDLDAW